MVELHRNDQELRRLEELEQLRQLGVNPYPPMFNKTHNTTVAKELYNDDKPDNADAVQTAGRIMALRRMGKATFCHIQDDHGRIQIYFKKDELPEVYELLHLFDIGDIIGVRGRVFRTKSGEISIWAKECVLLCKSLRVLPVAKEETDEQGNKTIHDAFADKEMRYRKRYLDLTVNFDVREVFVKRSKLIASMRRFFDRQGWMEVETPILQPLYGGAMARPFITHHNALGVDLYLRIALELYLKRLIVGGFEGVYEISKNFRNEGMDKSHNPEFTMMEIYVAYKDYEWMAEMTESLVSELCMELHSTYSVAFSEDTLSFKPPFRRAKMFDLLREATGQNLQGMTREELLNTARKNKVEVESTASAMKILDEIFSQLVQHTLIQPTFVFDYPVEMSPLAKAHRTEPGLVERFELFAAGTEIANCFSELNDPIEQRKRFEDQVRVRIEGDDEAMVMDEDFLYALEIGMPPTAGLGIGIDRLVMLLIGQTSIRDVLLFPQMKPEKFI